MMTMATVQHDERRVSAEWLKKFGAKWGVLSALGVDFGLRGLRVPPEVHDHLQAVGEKIASGSFSPCEVGCTLEKVEGLLVSIGSSLGEAYLRPWFDLLAQAMEGHIDPRRLSDIPALAPVAKECGLLVGQRDEAVTISETRGGTPGLSG
jgi:hypothetical protein